MDMPALANVTNAMVALVNENTRLKQINGLLSERLKELEHEEDQGQGQESPALDDAEGHER
jgi:hypothetical protein